VKALKIILWISAIGSSLSGFVTAILPWHVITGFIASSGVQPPGDEPSTIYMFRLGFMAYGMMGVFFGILARNPLKYGVMLPFAACFLVCYSLFRLVGGILYQYPIWHYMGDVITGIVFGVLILILRKRALKSSNV
jgi:hypothetical protein